MDNTEVSMAGKSATKSLKDVCDKGAVATVGERMMHAVTDNFAINPRSKMNRLMIDLYDNQNSVSYCYN